MMPQCWGDKNSCVEYDFLGFKTHDRIHDVRRVAVRVHMFNFANAVFIPLEVSRDNHGMTNNGAVFRSAQSRQVPEVPFPGVQPPPRYH